MMKRMSGPNLRMFSTSANAKSIVVVVGARAIANRMVDGDQVDEVSSFYLIPCLFLLIAHLFCCLRLKLRLILRLMQIPLRLLMSLVR